MNTNRPPESVELRTVGVLPVQSFVAQAVPLPPGTPARPRPDRPPLPGGPVAAAPSAGTAPPAFSGQATGKPRALGL